MPNNDILYRRPVTRGGEILTADAMHNSPANDAIASTMAKGCRSVCILIILSYEPFEKYDFIYLLVVVF